MAAEEDEIHSEDVSASPSTSAVDSDELDGIEQCIVPDGGKGLENDEVRDFLANIRMGQRTRMELQRREADEDRTIRRTVPRDQQNAAQLAHAVALRQRREAAAEALRERTAKAAAAAKKRARTTSMSDDAAPASKKRRT
jgi:peptidoglycan hydrolase CwlO-like protein